MDVKAYRTFKVFKRPLPPQSQLIYPTGTPKGFLVDKLFVPRLRAIPWTYTVLRGNLSRARGYFGRATRQYLHRYILSLVRIHYPEVTFANGDEFDCRLVNLKCYRRYEEGAQRRLFKNSSSLRKGVSFRANKKGGRWVAMIRARGKLRHLGYFRTADQAAREYNQAWNIAHPTLRPLPV
jgi:hypothetical protein